MVIAHAGVQSVYELLVQLVHCLVDYTDDVHVTVDQTDDSITFRIQASPLDIGKLIGKQGRTARSIRAIIGAASMKIGQRFSVDIVSNKSDT